MADISMCSGVDCPLKENCYRYTAIKSDYQAYFMGVLYNEEDRVCKYFWQNDLNISKNE